VTPPTREPVRFRFPRRDHRSLLLGLRGPQVAVLAVSAVAAVSALTAVPSAAGLGLAVVVFVVGVPLAVVRVRGRTFDEWFPALVRWAAVQAGRRRRWTSSLPVLGETGRRAEEAEPPPPLAGVEFLRVARAGGRGAVAVVRDRRAGTYSGVLACRGRGFALLDAADQERLMGLWGQALAAFAQEGSPVTRLAWVVRSRPEDAGVLEACLEDEAVLDPSHPARASYGDLLAGAAPAARRHETHLVLSVGGDRSKRAVRQAGGGDRGACEVLLRELASLAERLTQAEVEVTDVLEPRQLAAVIRSAFDPRSADALARRGRRDPEHGGVAGRNAWPLATESDWDRYRSDSGVHAAYWVADWPRRDVVAGFLHPLLVRPAGLSAMAVVMEPVPPSRATRAVESAHASHVADEELRAKVGYLGSARRRKEHQAILAREAELAEGHGEFRFSGYVSVSALDPEALEAAAADIEQAGFDAQVELRRLYAEQDRGFTYTLPLGRGLGNRSGAGRPAHRATTATIQSLYPFVAASGLGIRAAYIGPELFGGPFCFDPWALYASQRITNPNVLVAGQVGRGKSSLVKSLLWRGAVFGRQAAVLDPKGEYRALAAALGVEPVRLRPGGGVRLNPLDPGPGAADIGPLEVERRRLALLQSIAAAALGRDLAPIERAACQSALEAVSTGRAVPTLPKVTEALMEPAASAAAQLRIDVGELARASHDLALEMRRLCEGDLRGMFDGPTSVEVDWNGPLVVLDFSELLDDGGLAVLMACATAWIQAAVMRPGAGTRYVVLDEAWRLLGHLGTARWLRASLKLARQYGVANVLVMHRLSDLLAAGAAGSEQVALASGLLADTETRVIYAQSESEIGATAELLGLGAAEQAELAGLPRGVALWKVGRSTHVVAHQLGQMEQTIVDTDAGMARKPGGQREPQGAEGRGDDRSQRVPPGPKLHPPG
jgi:hypothetical protein